MAPIPGLGSMTVIRERSWPHSHRKEGARAVGSHVGSVCCFKQNTSTKYSPSLTPHSPQLLLKCWVAFKI